ncbi:hypothetical protein B0H17DRAFT_1140172 [Mycena rosella]|uniref:F-box domain-containing protein n=1 Tax=Mycena rosella TaxID=1033263 RepID=A0AAD7GBP9_MYCRO|nr:hypothetical protein B0H17DRAFT_1140172 [Mycena rosella]
MVAFKHVPVKLRNARKDAVDTLHRSSSILFIIRRLPEDVLGEIFCHTGFTVRRVQHPRQEPVDTGSHLQLVARHQPLPFGPLRSKACRLAVRLQNGDVEPFYSTQNCRSDVIRRQNRLEAVDFLFDFSRRWETVNVQIWFRIIDMLPILDRAPGRMPMLRELRYALLLRPCRFLTEYPARQRYNFPAFVRFVVLPNLKNINITYNIKSLPSLIDKFSCSLQKLTLVEFQPGDLAPMLDRTPKLLEMSGGSPPGRVSPTAPDTFCPTWLSNKRLENEY